MDVIAMRKLGTEHLRIAREERRPTLVEAFTYRYRGHSAADPEVYREPAEVDEWRERDPIETFTARLRDAGVIDDTELAQMNERVEALVAECVAFADNSPEPALESLYDDLYVFGDQVKGWYAARPSTRSARAARCGSSPRRAPRTPVSRRARSAVETQRQPRRSRAPRRKAAVSRTVR
jgi:hypothetical protein